MGLCATLGAVSAAAEGTDVGASGGVTGEVLTWGLAVVSLGTFKREVPEGAVEGGLGERGSEGGRISAVPGT